MAAFQKILDELDAASRTAAGGGFTLYRLQDALRSCLAEVQPPGAEIGRDMGGLTWDEFRQVWRRYDTAPLP